MRGRWQRSLILSLLLTLVSISAAAQSSEAVRTLAQREKQPLLDTLKALLEIESGSTDIEGVTRIGALIAERLQFANTVVARFHGRGSARILLLAHMDTVYERGMLTQQPFRVDGDRAYGLGIADAKHGIAVILHALTMLSRAGWEAKIRTSTASFITNAAFRRPASRVTQSA